MFEVSAKTKYCPASSRLSSSMKIFRSMISPDLIIESFMLSVSMSSTAMMFGMYSSMLTFISAVFEFPNSSTTWTLNVSEPLPIPL